jgi:hypothetical protein
MGFGNLDLLIVNVREHSIKIRACTGPRSYYALISNSVAVGIKAARVRFDPTPLFAKHAASAELIQLLIHLPVAYLLVYSVRLATPVAPNQSGRRVLWARNRLRESRPPRTPSLPKSLRRVPVELLRMRRTDSQLALKYYRAATSARGHTGEMRRHAHTAVEFAFSLSGAWRTAVLGRIQVRATGSGSPRTQGG